MLIAERNDTFSNLVGFLAIFAMSVPDPKGMEAFQRLHPLKARLEGVARLVPGFCLRKREVAAKPTFIRMLAQFFNEFVAEWTTAVISVGKTSTVVRGEYPHPEGGGTGSISGVSANTRVATKG